MKQPTVSSIFKILSEFGTGYQHVVPTNCPDIMKLTTYEYSTKFWLNVNKVVRYFLRIRIRASIILNYGPDPYADELWIRAGSGPDLEICVAIEKFVVK
jgi:hypothetical protein